MRNALPAAVQSLAASFVETFKREGVTVADMLILRSGVTVDCSTEADARKVAKLLTDAGCRNVSCDQDPDTDAGDLWFVVCDYPAR